MRLQRNIQRQWLTALATAFVFGTIGLAQQSKGADEGRLALQQRAQVESPEGSGKYQSVEKAAEWDPKATAIIVCDMWDLHHSLNATLRLKEMAPRMDQMLRAARARGVLVIHAPSNCM